MMTHTNKRGKVFMIPTPIGGINNQSFSKVATETINITLSLRYFVVENIKTSRRYLRQLNANFDIDNSVFYILNKHTKSSELNEFIQPCRNGENIGILSEAGCPGIADPGQKITLLAHNEGIDVVPLIGPSSIFLALMSSGLNGQQFSFHGYLPRERKDRISKIKTLANNTTKDGSQIFMEAPFRNNHILDDILEFCPKHIKLCIASDISTPNESITTKTIKYWKEINLDINKKPTIFIFGI